MTLTHLTPADYVTTQWSGGATTQLAIAPKGAVYADRDFLSTSPTSRPCPTMTA